RAEGGPLLIGGLLVGFAMPRGPDIGPDAIRQFLDRQQHLLPPGQASAISRR
ncbi:MAG: hypothetical protein HC871_13755, partial [Rhizobiales bacterium]|nr:hypothetical protein [Hyphomicrobiales bacterium]